MKRDKYAFPAIFDYAEDGITVEFPDLPGCITEGDSEEEALAMAREALALRLYTMERDNETIPVPTSVRSIALSPDQTVVLIDVWMPPFRDAINERAIKKTVTIPKWLNDLAENESVNFSLILQRGLKDYLGVCESGGEYRTHQSSEVTLRPGPAVADSPARWTVQRKAIKPRDRGKPTP